jgi:plastocyanin
MTPVRTLAVIVGVSLVAPGAAMAQNYPPPSDPGKKVVRPRGKPATLHVCKQRRKNCFRKIQKAVNAARPGDVIRIGHGVYREGVVVSGRGKRRLKLIGDRRHPGKVVLDGKGLRGPRAQNGVIVNSAGSVTVAGLKGRNYKGNCFFAVNVTGYLLTDLIAERCGAYGVYAFNSKGGTMSDSVAYWNNDSGFYVGQTPPQSKPKRTVVKNVDAYANTLGFSGTNMRYTTITRSRWFNNGLGIVPNSLDSEKYAPPSDNVIIGNDVFWNNFNYYAGAPFKLRPEAGGLPAYPVGTGILLFGGQRERVEDNRVFGNWLVGIGLFPQVLQSGPTKEDPQAQRGVLKDNEIVDNQMGLGGADLNGRDLLFDGSGSGNCFSGNNLRSPNLPADNSTFAACPFSGPNAFSGPTQAEAFNWALAPSKAKPDSFEQFWVRHPHASRKGVKPFVRCSEDAACRKGLRGRSSSVAAAAAKAKIVKVGDYFLKPADLSVAAGTKVTWRWPKSPGDQHDVKLTKGPKGVKRFHSELAASDYSFSRRLRKKGKYTVICTLHPDTMRQKIKVK